jgi:thioredoxin 2
MSNLVVRCPVCAQQNRLPMARLGERPRCGKCHETRLLCQPIPVNEATLAELIAQSKLPLLVDFWAPWCGPCRTVAPVLDEMAQRRGGDTLFLKVNVDENQRASAQHGISGIPALVLFDKGGERQRLVGAHPKRSIEALLDQNRA